MKMENPVRCRRTGVSVTLRTWGTSVVVGVSIVIPHLFASSDECSSRFVHEAGSVITGGWIASVRPVVLGVGPHRIAAQLFSTPTTRAAFRPSGDLAARWLFMTTSINLGVISLRTWQSSCPVGGFCSGDRVAERAASPKSPCPWAWRASKPMYHGSGQSVKCQWY